MLATTVLNSVHLWAVQSETCSKAKVGENTRVHLHSDSSTHIGIGSALLFCLRGRQYRGLCEKQPMALVQRGMALVRHGTGPAWHWSSVALVRRGTGPAWHWSGVALVRCGTGPAWHWSGVALVRRGMALVRRGMALVRLSRGSKHSQVLTLHPEGMESFDICFRHYCRCRCRCRCRCMTHESDSASAQRSQCAAHAIVT
jgi:hypothetical protein